MEELGFIKLLLKRINLEKKKDDPDEIITLQVKKQKNESLRSSFANNLTEIFSKNYFMEPDDHDNKSYGKIFIINSSKKQVFSEQFNNGNVFDKLVNFQKSDFDLDLSKKSWTLDCSISLSQAKLKVVEKKYRDLPWRFEFEKKLDSSIFPVPERTVNFQLESNFLSAYLAAYAFRKSIASHDSQRFSLENLHEKIKQYFESGGRSSKIFIKILRLLSPNFKYCTGQTKRFRIASSILSPSLYYTYPDEEFSQYGVFPYCLSSDFQFLRGFKNITNFKVKSHGKYNDCYRKNTTV